MLQRNKKIIFLIGFIILIALYIIGGLRRNKEIYREMNLEDELPIILN